MLWRNQTVGATTAAVAMAAVALAAALGGQAAAAPGQTTQVTTYVIKTQEERESTRWTLTEWLRIKERMRMMDLWLALFSDPKKDQKFQPELMVSYALTRGRYQYSGTTAGETGALDGTSGKAQLWLTNLISSTVGVRTLNIDLGAEAAKRQSGSFASTTAATGNLGAAFGDSRKLDTEYYTGNLRIFGKNIQDTSLVLKYGRYQMHNAILDAASPGDGNLSGNVAGGELQLYLLHFLGAEGNYLRFNASGSAGAGAVSGEYYDYMGFLEVSLLRITAGVYGESWRHPAAGGAAPLKTQERGSLAGLKLQL